MADKDEPDAFPWGRYFDYCETFAACPDRETLASWERTLRGDKSVNDRTKKLLQRVARRKAAKLDHAGSSPGGRGEGVPLRPAPPVNVRDAGGF